MKIFKKFLAALIAVVMALGVFAFAACKDDGKGSREGEGEGPGPNGGGITTAQVLNVLKAQQVKQLEIVFASTSKMKTENDGTVTEVEVSKSGYDAKYNLTDKNGDIETYYAEYDGTKLVYDYGYNFIRDGYSFTQRIEYGETVDRIENDDYSSVNLYYDGSATMGGVDMFSVLPVALPNVNYAVAKLADVAGALTINNGVVTLDYNKTVYKMVQDIKDVVDGLEETTTVGDILANEKVRKYLSVFTELIPSNQVIETGLKALPALLEAFSKLGEDDFEEMFGDMGAYLMMAQALLTGVSFEELAKVSPEGCETTYDYIVKILGSDALRDIVNAVLGNLENLGGGDVEETALTAAEGEEPAEGEEEAEQGLPNLTNISVGLILGMVNAGKEDSEKLTLEGLKTAFGEMAKTVTEEGFYFTMPAIGEGGSDNETDMQDAESSDSSAPAPMYISGAKIEYTISGGAALAAQDFSVNVSMDNQGAKIETEYTASIMFNSVKYQLADISNNTVYYSAEYCNSGTTVSYSSSEVVLNTLEGEEPEVYPATYGGNYYSYTFEVINGEIKANSLKVYDKDKNVVTPETDGSYTFEVYRRLKTTDENGRPEYDYTDKKTTTLEITVTGGIITQEFIDGLENENQKEWCSDNLGGTHYKVIRDGNDHEWGIVSQLTGTVGDLLTHLKAQASQPNA